MLPLKYVGVHTLFGRQVPTLFRRLHGLLSGALTPVFEFDVVTGNTSAGSSNADQFKLPTHSSGTYDFNVDWGDGSDDDITTWDQAEVTHTYASAGTYTVKITVEAGVGRCKGWSFANTGDKLKFTTVYSWGPLELGGEGANFYGTTNMAGTPGDTPILSGWTSGSQTFRASGFNFSVNSWDITNLTTLVLMFQDCPNFNQPLDKWMQTGGNIAVVGNLQAMFSGTGAFDQPLNGWDVSGITEFTSLFSGSVFNQPLNNWDMSAAVAVTAMFFNGLFNSDVSGWDLSSCTNLSGMFEDNAVFNQPIGDWTLNTVGSVTLSAMFRRADAFNQPLNAWDISGVTNVGSMFQQAFAFNQPLNLWDVSGLTSFALMFNTATGFDQDLGGWDITALTDATSMFNAVTLSTANYESLLVGWEANTHNNDVVFHGGDSLYNDPSSAATARTALVADGWTITDGGTV